VRELAPIHNLADLYALRLCDLFGDLVRQKWGSVGAHAAKPQFLLVFSDRK